MKTIHFNCDLGEGGKNDAALMPFISACNIACGGHAGTEESMRKTVRLALKYGVETGAHPSYPDEENFGRKTMQISVDNLKQALLDQIFMLKTIVEEEGGKLHHIKTHGALYNDAARDEKIAGVLLEVISEINPVTPLFVPVHSRIADLAKGKISLVSEAFADRNYKPDYSLVSRAKPEALITKKEAVFKHLSSMYFDHKIPCLNGVEIPVFAATFCFHSDTPNAEEILSFSRQKMEEIIQRKSNS